MKAIMVMFDSLNRHMLPPYGCDWTHAPNFQRLAARSVTFDKSYVCSMPCMPARRDLHTGRPNFLHCGWGPLEPFDDSMPEMLKQAGVYSHLCSDHYHYWEDGGATYHSRYNTWEFFRGQEGDTWKGQVAEPNPPPNLHDHSRGWATTRQDWVNRKFLKKPGQRPQEKTFAAGIEFIERNCDEDNWFLQIECFDPHEPFDSRRQYKDLYPNEYDGALLDWPAYSAVSEPPEVVEHVRRNYAALLSMCDAHLGDVLDAMDKHQMWDDTMLIVWTDHGYLLGEHGCWAKNWMPLYDEIAHTPFFVWDPRCGSREVRSDALVQPSIDLAPTLLDFFGLEPTPNMLGHSLTGTIASDLPVREAAIFGYHGSRINVTDGRYIYLRDVVQGGDGMLHSYTLMPTHMRSRYSVEELQNVSLAPAFSFSKELPLLKVERGCAAPEEPVHLLFDTQVDPHQEAPLEDAGVESQMVQHMTKLMQEADAPAEQFVRMGLR